MKFESTERAISQFNKQPERYIDLAIRSDIKIQLLLTMFIFDYYIEIDDELSKLLKKIPIEILTDLRKSVNSEMSGQNATKEEIEQFVIKYSLDKDEHKISKISEADDLKGTPDRYIVTINDYAYVVKWIEGAVSALRQEKLTELGL